MVQGHNLKKNALKNENFNMIMLIFAHSSILAWRILWMEESGGLLSIGSHSRTRLRQLSMHSCTHWRRKWQPTPVFLPGESQGWRSLVVCHLWGLTESDKTEAT